jgi:hypothetical protein
VGPQRHHVDLQYLLPLSVSPQVERPTRLEIRLQRPHRRTHRHHPHRPTTHHTPEPLTDPHLELPDDTPPPF